MMNITNVVTIKIHELKGTNEYAHYTRCKENGVANCGWIEKSIRRNSSPTLMEAQSDVQKSIRDSRKFLGCWLIKIPNR